MELNELRRIAANVSRGEVIALACVAGAIITIFLFF